MRAPDCLIEGGPQIGSEPAEKPAPDFPVHGVIATVAGLAWVVLWMLGDSEQANTVTVVAFSVAAVFYVARRWPTPQPPVDLDVRVPLSTLFQVHEERVAGFVGEGHVLPARFDCDEFLQAQQRYVRHPRVWWQFAGAMLGLLVVQLILLLLPATIAAGATGLADPAPWATLAATGLVGLYLRFGCSSAGVVRIVSGRWRQRDVNDVA